MLHQLNEAISFRPGVHARLNCQGQALPYIIRSSSKYSEGLVGVNSRISQQSAQTVKWHCGQVANPTMVVSCLTACDCLSHCSMLWCRMLSKFSMLMDSQPLEQAKCWQTSTSFWLRLHLHELQARHCIMYCRCYIICLPMNGSLDCCYQYILT
jgi:hypothetical protein